MHERVDSGRSTVAEHGDRLAGQLTLAQQTRAQRVIDVVVDVGDAVDQPHDAPLQRAGRIGAPGVAGDPVPDLLGQVQSGPVALQLIDDAQRMLVVAKPAAEALAQAAVEHLLADVPERRMPEVVTQPDRLGQVLVQSERTRDRA